MASDMASQILSGCPSVTDSEVNNLFSIVNSPLYQYFIFVNNIKYLYYDYYIFCLHCTFFCPVGFIFKPNDFAILL